MATTVFNGLVDIFKNKINPVHLFLASLGSSLYLVCLQFWPQEKGNITEIEKRGETDEPWGGRWKAAPRTQRLVVSENCPCAPSGAEPGTGLGREDGCPPSPAWLVLPRKGSGLQPGSQPEPRKQRNPTKTVPGSCPPWCWTHVSGTETGIGFRQPLGDF